MHLVNKKNSTMLEVLGVNLFAFVIISTVLTLRIRAVNVTIAVVIIFFVTLFLMKIWRVCRWRRWCCCDGRCSVMRIGVFVVAASCNAF